MKKLIKANPVGVALVIFFLILIAVGVITSHGATRRATKATKDKGATSGVQMTELAGNLA